MTTINIEGRRVRVSDDFRNLSPEAQQRTVEEIARQIGVRSAGPSGPMRAVGLFNEGLAGFGDAIGGTANQGINAVFGTNLSQTPVADVFDRAGVARTNNPRNLLEHGLQGVGEAAGAIMPAATALRGAQRVGGALGAAAQSARQALATRLGVSAELGAGAGARMLPEASNDHRWGERALEAVALTADTIGRPINQAFGIADHNAADRVTPAMREGAQDVMGALMAVGGGVAGGGIIAAAPSVGRGLATAGASAVDAFPMAGTLARNVAATAAPFTNRGARMIAEDMVRGATADRFAAADQLAQPNVGNLTPAQQTGSAGIMGIERGVAAADPRFAERLSARTAASREALTTEVGAPAEGRTPRDTRAFFAERQERHRETLSRYVQQAERRLDARMRSVQPGRQREEASIWVTRELEQAFERATREEARLWNRVPQTVQIGTAQARAALAQAAEEATEVSAHRIPGLARRFLGNGDEAFGETASMRQLHRLYSEVRRAGREAMAQPVPDEFTARQANRIADGILADIQATEGTTNAARLLADARAYSHEMAEQFGQGNVARIMARTRAGDDRIPAGEALRATVGQPREAGGVAVDDIRRAAGPSADPPMQDFLRDEFLMSATRPDGSPDPAAVDRFTRTRREAIARFPDGVEREVLDVRAAASEVVRRRDRMDTVLSALGETTRGTVAGVVNAPRGREIARGIFEAENPASAARTIARAAQRDGTGDAYLGLKAGLYDEVISRATVNGALSGERLARVLADPEMRRVLSAALPPGEVSRLRTIASQMRKIETSLTAGRTDTYNTPNTLLSSFMQIQMAKAGRSVGTGTIQVPGMFVARGREIMSRLFNDKADVIIRAALEDPRIMSDLLVGPSAGRARQREAHNRLMNWAIGALAASETED